MQPLFIRVKKLFQNGRFLKTKRKRGLLKKEQRGKFLISLNLLANDKSDVREK